MSRSTARIEQAVPERTIPSFVLILVACILAPVSVVAVWIADVIGNTDRYVATMAPLARNPAVQDAVASRVGALVTQELNASGLTNSALSDLSGLGLGGGINDVVGSVVGEAAGSDQFAAVWDQANRDAHDAVFNVVTGQPGILRVHGDVVVVDLAPIVDQVKAQLVADGFGAGDQIPTVHTDYTLLVWRPLPGVTAALRVLYRVGPWSVAITLVLGTAGVLLARRRRTALFGAGVGTAAAMLALGVLIAVGRAKMLDAVPAGSSHLAAAAIYDTLLRFVTVTLRTVGILAVALAVGAYLCGPGSLPVAMRRGIGSAIDGLRRRSGLREGPLTARLRRVRRWAAGAVLVVAAAVFLVLNTPTAGVVISTLAVVMALLTLLEFLAPGAEPSDRRLRALKARDPGASSW